MKTVPVWIYYSVLRVVVFAAPLALLLVLRIDPLLATVIAAVIGFCLSYLFLRKSREAMSRDLYAARHRTKEPVSDDDATEDAAVDRADDETAAVSTAVSTADPADLTASVGTESERESKPE